MERRLSRVSKCLPNVLLGWWKVWWPHDQRRLTQVLQLLASVAHRELPRLAVKALDVGSVYKRKATVAVIIDCFLSIRLRRGCSGMQNVCNVK